MSTNWSLYKNGMLAVRHNLRGIPNGKKLASLRDSNWGAYREHKLAIHEFKSDPLTRRGWIDSKHISHARAIKEFCAVYQVDKFFCEYAPHTDCGRYGGDHSAAIYFTTKDAERVRLGDS